MKKVHLRDDITCPVVDLSYSPYHNLFEKKDIPKTLDYILQSRYWHTENRALLTLECCSFNSRIFQSYLESLLPMKGCNLDLKSISIMSSLEALSVTVPSFETIQSAESFRYQASVPLSTKGSHSFCLFDSGQ